MKNLVLVFFSVFLTMTANARITDNQVVFKSDAGFLKIEPKKGFHLNAEAPANASFDALEALYKPTQKTEKLFAFKIVNNTKKAKLSFYVCDDKKTVCEQHQEEVTLATLKSQAAVSSYPPPPAGGFMVTDTAKDPADIAKDELLVSKNGKPTLLVFAAPWCPACIRMHTETYTAPKVSQELKQVNFVQLNSDLAGNFDLSEKFHVKAIPTLILLNTQGEEVYRWLDYQPAADFAKSLHAEVTKVASSKSSLEKTAGLGDAKAISEVGQLYYNSLDYEQAIKWLSLSKKPEDQKLKLAAEVSLAQEQSEKDEKNTPEYLRSLEKAITLTSSSLDQTRWTVDWIEKKAELKQMSEDMKVKARLLLNRLEDQIKNKKVLVQDFKKSTFGDSTGFEVAEANLMRSRLFAALDQKDDKAKSDQKIIDSLKDRKFTVQKPGEMLIGIAYLREAGEKKRVDQMYHQLLKKYPTTYVYYEKYGRYLLKEKDLDRALENSDLALKYAEGNQPQLYLLKARILKEQNQKEKVIATVNEAEQFKDIQHAKFKKTLAQLTKLKEEASTKQ